MRRKPLLIGLFIFIIFLIGGLLYWNFITSPKYSLLKVKKSIDNHDISTFEKYVDVDGITVRLLTEMPKMFSADKATELFGEEVSQLILGFAKESIIKMAKESVRCFIERGHFDDKITRKGAISW